jgi:hypothetical protein
MSRAPTVEVMADTELPHRPPAAMPGETALTGGRLTPGVVRVGDTVRRPTGPHWLFVHALLAHLEVQDHLELDPVLHGTDGLADDLHACYAARNQTS